MITRRTIPEKLLVVKADEPAGKIINLDKKTVVVRSKVMMAGRAPEGEYQITEGMIIQHTIGGQTVVLDDVSMTLIGLGQILYIE